jgi:hypothetical protein
MPNFFETAIQNRQENWYKPVTPQQVGDMFKVGPVTKYDPKLDSVVTPRLEQTKQDYTQPKKNSWDYSWSVDYTHKEQEKPKLFGQDYKATKNDIVESLFKQKPKIREAVEQGHATVDDVMQVAIKRNPKIRQAILDWHIDMSAMPQQQKPQSGGKFSFIEQQGDWKKYLSYMQTTNEATTVEDTFREFGKNILKSAYNLWAWVGNMALHPVDSAKMIGMLGVGGIQNAYEMVTWEEQNWESAEMASRVGEYFKNRYGSMEWFQEASYNDPVGVFSDLTSIISWGATIAWKTASVGGKVAKLWGKVWAAEQLATFGKKAIQFGDAVNEFDPATHAMRLAAKPYQIAGKALKVWAGMVADSKAGQFVWEKARGLMDMTWLRPTTKKLLEENPYLAEMATRSIDDANGKYSWELQTKDIQELHKTQIQLWNTSLDESFWKYLREVGVTWKFYEEAKSFPVQKWIKSFTDWVDGILKKYDIKVNTDWSYDFAGSKVDLKERWHVKEVLQELNTLSDKSTSSNLLNTRTTVW